MEAGDKKGFVEAYMCDLEEITDDGFSVMCSEDYTEDIFKLGFCFARG